MLIELNCKLHWQTHYNLFFWISWFIVSGFSQLKIHPMINHNSYNNSTMSYFTLSLCVHGVQYTIYSTRGVVEWLIKHKAKPSALSDTRPLLKCCKSYTAWRKHALTGLLWFSLTWIAIIIWSQSSSSSSYLGYNLWYGRLTWHSTVIVAFQTCFCDE